MSTYDRMLRDPDTDTIKYLIDEAYEWEGLAAENDDHSGNIDKAVAVQGFLQSYLPEPYDPSAEVEPVEPTEESRRAVALFLELIEPHRTPLLDRLMVAKQVES